MMYSIDPNNDPGMIRRPQDVDRGIYRGQPNVQSQQAPTDPNQDIYMPPNIPGYGMGPNIGLGDALNPGGRGQLPLNANEPPKPGRIKQILFGFLQGMSDGLKHEAGIPTSFEEDIGRQRIQLEQNRAKMEQILGQSQVETNQSLIDQRKTMGEMAPLQLPDGTVVMANPKERAQYLIQKMKNDAAAQRQDKSLGIGITIDADMAKKIPGGEQLVGKQIPLTQLAKLMGDFGKDTVIKDIGGRAYLMNKRTGEKLKDLGESNAVTAGEARAWAFNTSRAATTRFDTFDSNGNLTTTTVAEAIKHGYPAAQVWNSIFGPTGATKTQGQAAGAVAEHIPLFIDSVKALDAKGQLGPVMGRLNAYLASGYGGDDPDIANFVTTVGLLKSGAVRAHFGARGGAQILDKFDKMLNTAQTSQALIGSINSIDSFLKTYKAVGTANPPRPNSGKDKKIDPLGIR